MKVSNTAAVMIIALVLLGLYLMGGCRMRGKNSDEKFTRTCTSADTNCRFVRTPVDYAFETQTEIPAHMNMDFPHLMGNPADKLQPLDDPCSGEIIQTVNGPMASKPCGKTRINLITDESKLIHPDKLWVQYENDYKGCGNGKPYIVNDDKTRFQLREVGDEWAVRVLEHQRVPEHGPIGNHPALTELDIIVPDQFDQLYGASWLGSMIGRG